MDAKQVLAWTMLFFNLNAEAINDNLDEQILTNSSRHFICANKHECARECLPGKPPKTCYYHFYVEQYVTMGRACDFGTSSESCQCILADGVERTTFTVNRVLPGPSIEVCEGDKVVVDVKNAIDGSETSIHWHGIHQIDTNYADGVPFVTQCPIVHGTTFRYQWRANAGTHFWHSHSGFQKMDGLTGSIVVRQKNDTQSDLYTCDLSEHVIIITDWTHQLSTEKFPGGLHRESIKGQFPDNLLINGKGQFTHHEYGFTTDTPLETFVVTSGKKYRFRVINAVGFSCSVQFTIQNHNLKIIGSDGEPVQSVVVSSMILASAERYDFVLNANQPVGNYWIQVKGLGFCAQKKIQQLAILRYNSRHSYPNPPRPSYDTNVQTGLVLNQNCASGLCVNHLKNAKVTDSAVLGVNVDVKLYLPIDAFVFDPTELFTPNIFQRFSVFSSGAHVANRLNEISNELPSSPLISQYSEAAASTVFCNGNNKPTNCGEPCYCTNKYDIKLNDVVEIILVDAGPNPNITHPIHLHGHTFYLIGMGTLPDAGPNTKLNQIKDLDSRELLQRQFKQPPTKDTIPLPSNGYGIIRFKATNPGFWLFHCHFANHLQTGMSVIFQVGNNVQWPKVPENFPRCGNFLPKIL